VAWNRNQEIDLVRNPNYWRDPAPFERVVIQHIGDSAAQLLALQNGDIDAALNLTPEQLNSLNGNTDVQIVGGTSLDYLYMTLTQDASKSPALANQPARQAVTRAIDYDGIINNLYGGNAVRPATFIPVGLDGSTQQLTQDIGFHQDLDSARQLLAQAGLPNGFSFDLSFANASIAGISYQVVAQKIQSDLARVGITANLKPMDQTNLTTQYRAGQLASVLTFWNPDAIEPWLWATASIERVAKRVHWAPPQSLVQIVSDAGAAADDATRTALYGEYQRQLVDQANYIILLQPIYRVATRTSITNYRLTAAGWQVDLYDIQPTA
jgi:peptide/nickel transport system substrate-binding protein